MEMGQHTQRERGDDGEEMESHLFCKKYTVIWRVSEKIVHNIALNLS